MTDTNSRMTFRKTRGTGFSNEGISDPYVEYFKEADWNLVKKNGFLQRVNGSYDLLLIIGIANLQIADESKLGALGAGAEKKDVKKAFLADTRSNVKSRLFLAEFMKMVA